MMTGELDPLNAATVEAARVNDRQLELMPVEMQAAANARKIIVGRRNCLKSIYVLNSSSVRK